MRLTGETANRRVGALSPSLAPQPGGRPAAPGVLGLLQAFLNTHFDLVTDHGADLLATRARARPWLAAMGWLPAGEKIAQSDLDRLCRAREALRQLVAAGQVSGGKPSASTARAINEVLTGATIELRFTAEGPELIPVGASAVDRVLGSLTGIVARALSDGSWQRLKVCPGPHCGWVFYDHSRNGSGRWCSMNVCGGREKARAHYRRRRGG
ncbi:MAG: CGNR zinc finger domain-containing protein [Solirubrobacterales bacterium]|nr:CGNR zinc finger domain-containing protein [Solirubrobacterales bacterium]